MLELENITKQFGGLVALDHCSFDVEKGSITGLIGPNGAGKTVLFNVVTGIYPPTAGTVTFKGEDITHEDTYELARRGIARGFQEPSILPEQSVRENFLMASRPNSVWDNFRSVLAPDDDSVGSERTRELLTELGLMEKSDTKSGELSYGQQKLVQFGILLMMEPEFIMLDEIMAGVNTEATNQITDYINKYNDEGITFLVIEHDMGVITKICDKVVVLDAGQRIAEGTPAEVKSDQQVKSAYMGQ